MTSRRAFLLGGTMIAAGAAAFGRRGVAVVPDAGRQAFEVAHSDAQWQRLLTPAQYDILRRHGTEPPWSSALDHETRNGRYRCAGCALALFDARAKYDSGTGWPSFWQPLDGAVGTVSDRSLLEARTEVHCRRCGGHLGHVFDDGPQPTGLRYCMNGTALNFTAI